MQGILGRSVWDPHGCPHSERLAATLSSAGFFLTVTLIHPSGSGVGSSVRWNAAELRHIY